MSLEHLEAKKTTRLRSKGLRSQLEGALVIPEWEPWSANKDNKCMGWNTDALNSRFMMMKHKAHWSPLEAGK